MLLLEELKSVPREDWPRLEARDVMRPVDTSMFINSNATIPQAQAALASNGLGRAVVLDSNGFIVGYISQRDINKGGKS